MNVVDNLNSVKVINKPCVYSSTMRLSTSCGLHRDTEHIQRTIAGEFPKPQCSITFQSVAGPAPYRVRGNEARYILTQAK
jgi:hypothetical protein